MEGAVIVLFLLGLSIFSAVQASRLRTQHRVRSAELNLLATALPSITDPSDIVARLQTTQSKEVLQEAWDKIHALRHLHAHDPRAVTADLPLSDERVFQSLRQLPNQLLLLGLFGTVFGLSLTLGDFAPQLGQGLAQLQSGGSASSLNSGMQELLERMKLSFVCTLWGVLLSLLAARFVVAPALLSRDALQTQIENLIAYHLVPKVWNHGAQLMVHLEGQGQRLDEVLQLLQHQFQGFETRTSQTLDTLADAGRQLSLVAADSGKVIQKTGLELQQTVRQLEQSNSVIHTSVQTLETHLTRSSTALEHNLVALNHQSHDFTEAQKRQLLADEQRTQTLLNQLTAFSDVQRDLAHTLNRDLQANVAQLGEVRDILHTQGQLHLTAQGDTQRSLTQALQQLQLDAANQQRGHVVALGDTQHQLSQIAERLVALDLLAQRLDPQALPTDRWQAFQTALETVVARTEILLREHEAARLAGTAALANAVDGIHQQHNLRTDALYVQFQEMTERIGKEIGSSTERWQHLYGELASRSTGTLHGQMNLANQLNHQHDAAQAQLQTMTGELLTVTRDLVGALERTTQQLTHSSVQSAPRTG
ncbi:hypothetical protein [Deinococcus marmoris]|uniref:hypothetical protein n=1 Tax=Deinococcus marmoris TaxID=249408 RepID=UPI0012DF886C|nr:hypothetical protein [Deinococcus marmoris]